MKNINIYLVKIDRVSAWILFATMLAYFISGYGMTKGLINAEIAANLHNEWLPLIMILAFCVHTFYAIHLAFERWRIWNIFTKALLVIFYTGLLSAFVWFNNFYEPQKYIQTTDTVGQDGGYGDEDSEMAEDAFAEGATDTFTPKSLAEYDGLDGMPAYLAVDGLVYDLSEVFVNGMHYGHKAGLDLTDAFYKRHIKEAIAKYPVMGELISE